MCAETAEDLYHKCFSLFCEKHLSTHPCSVVGRAERRGSRDGGDGEEQSSEKIDKERRGVEEEKSKEMEEVRRGVEEEKSKEMEEERRGVKEEEKKEDEESSETNEEGRATTPNLPIVNVGTPVFLHPRRFVVCLSFFLYLFLY
jgi:hypothetical protein